MSHPGELNSELAAIEYDAALYEEVNFNKRADALDFIDFHIVDWLDGLTITETPSHKQLKAHAVRVAKKLQNVDNSLFTRLKNSIRAEYLDGSSFMGLISPYTDPILIDGEKPPKEGYNNLDLFVNKLLGEYPLPEPTKTLEPEMVYFQKTPVRIVFEMAAKSKLKPGDVFFDIGSGLGQVVLLMRLLTGATAKGVEFEPAYNRYARKRAIELNLAGVEFITARATEADYSNGSAFFLYTPFKGQMLSEMMDILKYEAGKRAVTIFSYGPCSAYINNLGWLKCSCTQIDPLRLNEFNSTI